MVRFTASMIYTPDEIRGLEKTINSTFYNMNNVLRYVVCIALIGWGFSRRTGGGFVVMAIGAMILGMGNLAGKYRANKTIEALNEQNLEVRYKFYENEFSVTAGKETNLLKYEDMIRIMEDNEYFYIFQSKDQVVKVDRKTLVPKKDQEFRTFVAKKVGLEWTHPSNPLSFNIRQMMFNRKNTRKVARNKAKEKKG